MDIEALEAAVETLDVPGTCDAIRKVIRVIDRLEAKLAPALDAVDRSGEWEVEGAVSMASWLRHHGRLTGGSAKTMLNVAAHLAELPVTRRAWEAGELSGSQVRAICANVSEPRVELFASHEADVVPSLAPLSVQQTAAAMALWRERADALHDGEAEPDADALSCSTTFGGARELRGSFSPAPGAVIDTALRLASTRDAEGEVRSPKQRRADALVAICQFFLDHQSANKGGRHRPHLNLVVNVDDIDAAGVFIDGTVASGALLETILCDCNLHRVLVKGRSGILDYGRSARTAPPDLFNALALRDGHCRTPGCDRPPAWCEAHHVVAWEDGGETSLANAVLKCSRHHHQWHKRRKLGWTERLEADGTLVIRDPNGRVYVSHPGGPVAQRQLLVG